MFTISNLKGWELEYQKFSYKTVFDAINIWFDLKTIYLQKYLK